MLKLINHQDKYLHFPWAETDVSDDGAVKLSLVSVVYVVIVQVWVFVCAGRIWLWVNGVHVGGGGVQVWGWVGFTHTHTHPLTWQHGRPWATICGDNNMLPSLSTPPFSPPLPPFSLSPSLTPHLPLGSLLNSWGVKAKQGEDEEEEEEGEEGMMVVKWRWRWCWGGGGVALWVTGQGLVPTNITRPDNKANCFCCLVSWR